MEELIVVGVLLTIFVVLYKKGLIRFTMNTYGKYDEAVTRPCGCIL